MFDDGLHLAGRQGLRAEAPAEEAGFVPIEIVHNFPVLSVSIGDQDIPVVFDLGGDNTIELTQSALEKITVRPLPDKYVWLDAKGNRLEARKFVIRNCGWATRAARRAGWVGAGAAASMSTRWRPGRSWDACRAAPAAPSTGSSLRRRACGSLTARGIARVID